MNFPPRKTVRDAKKACPAIPTGQAQFNHKTMEITKPIWAGQFMRVSGNTLVCRIYLFASQKSNRLRVARRIIKQTTLRLHSIWQVSDKEFDSLIRVTGAFYFTPSLSRRLRNLNKQKTKNKKMNKKLYIKLEDGDEGEVIFWYDDHPLCWIRLTVDEAKTLNKKLTKFLDAKNQQLTKDEK